ncbi:MAG: 30S ribosomal protein S16 [Nocardioidaceae bacterium]|nr:30S ribosomal protein S16 [Nocardioidaceae bacterium]
MAVKIRLKRMGKIRAPHYRIVVADARTKRDGRVIEEIGLYHPKEDPSFIEVNSERAQYWLSVGARASEPVTAILKVTGDWQKFKGEAAPAPMKVAEPKRDKTEIFNEALKDSTNEPKTEAVTAKKGAAKRPPASDAPPAEAPLDDRQAAADQASTVSVADAPASDAPAEADTSDASDTPADAPASDAPAADDKSES